MTIDQLKAVLDATPEIGFDEAKRVIARGLAEARKRITLYVPESEAHAATARQIEDWEAIAALLDDIDEKRFFSTDLP